MVNDLLGGNSYSNSLGNVAAAGVWMIVSLVLAIVGGMVLYFLIFIKSVTLLKCASISDFISTLDAIPISTISPSNGQMLLLL